MSRRRRYGTTALTVALIAVAAAAGAAFSHAAWPVRNGSAAGGGSGTSPFGSGQSPFFGSGGSNGSGGSGAEGAGGPADVSAIAAKVDPALVDINVTFGYQSAQGAGTGIVLTSNGEVLTNNHVIDGATKISVTDIGNGKTYTASVLGYDNSQDVAVLQLQNASGLTTAKIGNSSNLAVGQAVVAVGNAGGSGGTPSSAGGSITALNQSITASDDLDGTSEQLSGLIQTNANIQAGDSGGSLVDVSGRVIGMDTAAAAGRFSLSGNQGYAIPINTAMNIAKQIRSGHGTSTTHVGPTAFLGVLVSSSGAQSGGNGGSGGPFGGNGGSFGGNGGFFGGGGFGGNGTGGGNGGQSVQGAAVSNVVNGGPAQQAGLAQGDVITSLGGQSVTSPSSLTQLLVPHHPGDHVSIGWVDSSGQSHTGTAILGSGPPA